MDNWIPVIGTLAGAIVAGTISVLIHWLSNRHAAQNTKLVFAEERARWAIEKRLERLQNFYGTVDKLLNTTSQFRIQQAWQASAESDADLMPPKWVLSYDIARGEWENQLGATTRELLMQDEEVQTQYAKSNIEWQRWLCTKTTEDGVQALAGMEKDIVEFSRWIAKRYRTQFEDRYRGTDHAP